MVLTVNHLIELFKEIPLGFSYDYVSGNGNKARLVSIDEGGKRIQMERITKDGSIDKTAYLNPDNLNTLANKIKENTPITIDFALGNNGNTRSVFEAILIRTSEFYKCVINNSKHMVWIPSKKHNAGELLEIKQEDIPNACLKFIILQTKTKIFLISPPSAPNPSCSWLAYQAQARAAS